nr:putative late blight resistance protein homolog R1B-14 isoform X1 [Ipomoea batatas]
MLPHYSKLLRVLEINQCYLGDVPRQIVDLVHLRYLALGIRQGASINGYQWCKLRCLQTIIIDDCSTSFTPNNILGLPQIRHVDFDRGHHYLDLPKLVQENLQTLSWLSLPLRFQTEPNFKGIPNVKELGIHLMDYHKMHSLSKETWDLLPPISMEGLLNLHQLENLKFEADTDYLKCDSKLLKAFPPNLKKLTLESTYFSWEDKPSENNCIIENVDNEVNFLNPYDFNDSDSFDSSDDDNGNCVDTCENNSFNSNDNDGLESFTFDDNSLLNEHVGELHDMLCNVDDALNVDASLLDLNDVEFDTFHDNCIDDAIYIHDLLGEEKEEMDGSERDALLNSEKEREDEKQETMVEGVENENDVLESFTFGDESLSNELANDLHEMLCGDDDMNIEASLCDLSDIECVTFHDNCLDDALYIHDLIVTEHSTLKHWSVDADHFPILECIFLNLCRDLVEFPTGFSEINTLQLIDLKSCRSSLVTSAKKIQEERRDLGDDKLVLR